MRSVAAALVALICWAGLAIQFSATYAGQHDVGATLWILLRFFTVLTNLAVALTMSAVAIGRKVSPFLLGGLTLAILLVGIVYMTLLRGLVELSGGALLADTLLHKVSPVAATLWWLVFAPRARLKRGDPIVWALSSAGTTTGAIPTPSWTSRSSAGRRRQSTPAASRWPSSSAACCSSGSTAGVPLGRGVPAARAAPHDRHSTRQQPPHPRSPR